MYNDEDLLKKYADNPMKLDEDFMESIKNNFSQGEDGTFYISSPM